jgi:hypothetical protein
MQDNILAQNFALSLSLSADVEAPGGRKWQFIKGGKSIANHP